MRSYAKEVVFSACRGRYNELALHFFPEMGRALATPGKHVPDPWKRGSKDGFRVMRDFNLTGYMVCNNNFGLCGKPFNLFNLMLFTGRASSFNDVLELVGNYLGCERTGMFLKGTRPDERKPLSLTQQQVLRQLQEQAAKAEAAAKAQHLQELAKNKAAIERQLKNCVSLFSGQADEVWRYLENRGLGMLKNAPKSLFKDLSYCPRYPYYEDGKLVGYFGALVSKVRNGKGELWSLHRTFLMGGKKAPVSCAKKLMSPAFDADGASRFIKLGEVPEHGVIGIAEGIETALSAYVGMRVPVWSAVSASLLEEFLPPAGVKAVLIFADLDANGVGQQAARKLQAKLRANNGIKSFVVVPKSPIPEGSKGIDWNDELRTKGVFAFPEPFSTMQFIQEHQNHAA